MTGPLSLRQQSAAISMAALSGFIVGMGFYVAVEYAFLWRAPDIGLPRDRQFGLPAVFGHHPAGVDRLFTIFKAISVLLGVAKRAL